MPQNRFHTLLLLAALITLTGPVWSTETRPPNILLIMADDLGYNDLYVYNRNPRARTPHIDKLAKDGVRFTRHYTDAVCSPSRAALMTGLFPGRLAGREGPRGVSMDVMTLADSLSAAGYRTHHVGKWHVRSNFRDAWPDRQGFQTYYGFINQLLLDGTHVNGKHVYGKARYEDPWLSANGEAARQQPGHLTDLLVENTVQSINAFKSEQPWFINFWSLAPHFPSDPSAQWASKYPDSRVGRYYALIEQLDNGVGRILQALEDSGQRQNTVVIFTSDNGGLNLGADNNAPLYGRKSEYNEGGIRTPLIMAWPDHYPTDAVVAQPVGIIDLFPTIAKIAGARVPARLDGYDIGSAIAGQDLPSRTQFYEVFRNGAFGYSVLSADGRWRLYIPEKKARVSLKGLASEPRLYDLGEDPTGHHNVYDNYPEIVERLTDEYRRWHRQARKLSLEKKEITGRGSSLTGDDFQRTPGYGGFSFAVTYQPLEGTAQASGVVAEQANAWSLELIGGSAQATLSIGEYALTADLETDGNCNTLIATAYFKITTMQPIQSGDEMVMDLYQNGKRIGRHSARGIIDKITDTTHATTVGYSNGARPKFSGSLGSPTLLNTYISPNTPISPSALHSELCEAGI
jgi:arylsulfatase A-like enzyme